MEFKEKIVIIFGYFYSKIDGKQYKGNLSKWEEKSIVNFSNLVKDKYGESVNTKWLFDYFSFQFEYWRSKTTKDFGNKGLAYIEWIIGKKGFERFLNKHKNWDYFVKEGVIKINSISFEEVRKLIKEDIIESNNLDLKYHEENEKLSYYNTKRGLFNCLEYTTLFNPLSNNCNNCNNKEECILLIKKNYSKIAIERGL